MSICPYVSYYRKTAEWIVSGDHMYQDKLVALIVKGGGKLYDPPRCFELDGRSYAFALAGENMDLKFGETKVKFDQDVLEYDCLKCMEGMYLVRCKDRFLLLNENTGLFAVIGNRDPLFADEIGAKPTDKLNGWAVSMVFAAGNAILCKFGEGGIAFDGGEIEAKVYPVGEDAYLVLGDTADGKLVLVMDTGRFLFSGFLAEKMILGGCFENTAE